MYPLRCLGINSMMISNKHKFVYMTVAKCGTSTMFKHLRELYDDIKLVGGHPRVVEPQHLDYFCFTVVRHPYTRALSMWHHILDRKKMPLNFDGGTYYVDISTFTKFIKWRNVAWSKITSYMPALRTQHYQLSKCRIDNVLRLETLSNDFMDLPFYSGPPILFSKENPALTPYSYGEYTDELVLLVNEIFAKDFAFGAYEMSPNKKELLEVIKCLS